MHLVETLARTALPASATAVANSLTPAPAVASAVDAFHWDRLGPLRAAEKQDDDRGRGAAMALTALREAVGADEFATKLGSALSATDNAVFEWLSDGQRVVSGAGSAAAPPRRCAHLRAAVTAAVNGPATTTLAKGIPASKVLRPGRCRRSWTRTATSR